jgi:hypothetical protein
MEVIVDGIAITLRRGDCKYIENILSPIILNPLSKIISDKEEQS